MIDESWYQRPTNIQTNESAGGVVFRRATRQAYIALVLEGRKHRAYILPKGRLEPGETIEATARREISEEAGFTKLKLCCKLGVRERLNLHKKAWKTIHYFLFETPQLASKPTDTQHDYHVDWFAISDLPVLFWPEQQEMLTLAVDWLQNHADLR
ncbi:MAG: NUDIX domain-containing protein [Spirulina sp. SIO3F2]|nr:NUDIX domain-containing protein [Spirulina sp. SIO3F2]